MKYVKILFAIALVFTMCSAFSLKKDHSKPVYAFGISASFTDTVVYFTEIQILDSVSLSKEGFLAHRELYSYQLKNYLEDNESYAKWSCQKDGASLIARMLFGEGTDINFFVGRAVNPAHQNPNLPIQFHIKMQMVNELAECLKKMGKQIKVSYF